MSHINQRINEIVAEVSIELVGGPQFETIITASAGGKEKRQIKRSESAGRWEFGEQDVNRTDRKTLQAFFQAAAGRAHSFRFKDWGDYEAIAIADGITPHGTATHVGVNTFQAYVTYGTAPYTRSKKILCPVADTIDVFVNGVETAATIDDETGLITVVALISDTVTWSGEFDLKARFDSDSFSTRFAAKAPSPEDDLFFLASLPVQELTE